jgi:muconate cycloisomerase
VSREIADVEATAVRLPMRAAFATSRGPVGSPAEGRVLVLVRLTDGQGRSGWGEAGPIPRWSPETAASVLDAVRQHLGPAVLGRDPADLGGLHAAMDAAIAPGPGRGMPIAKAAVDLAAHDLLGRQTGLPLWALLGRRGRPEVRLSWTVLGPDPAAAVRAGQAAGFAHFNVKVGGPGGPAADAELVQAVRAAAGPAAFVWADANGAYTPLQALEAARLLARAGADVLEQPLPPHALLASRELVAAHVLPIALDEPVTGPGELAQAIALRALDIHVLKVTRTGGLYPARACAELALAAGLGLLSSGLTDGGLAFAANVALAAAFGVDRPCALNGPQLLADDILAAPLPRTGDVVRAPSGPGLGVEVDEEKVAAYRLPV